MTVHHFPIHGAKVLPASPAYFTAEGLLPLVQPLRPLNALEQMYAYWGSDRG
ncbi:hypothetical protein [Tabrizicola sp.]|uniref:hypothetical protein n=1 Tax=Tabrizicola sp. TaxID=2005166 RepID=UPI0026050743|nr:hypothetical protein [Tabrizicola sp.]MDM7933346.1 hypothetical protein [Tabrizicola sp.]